MREPFLSDDMFTGKISRYFETEEEIILDGIVYDKFTLEQKKPIEKVDLTGRGSTSGQNNCILLKNIATMGLYNIYANNKGSYIYSNSILYPSQIIKSVYEKDTYYYISMPSQDSYYAKLNKISKDLITGKWKNVYDYPSYFYLSSEGGDDSSYKTVKYGSYICGESKNKIYIISKSWTSGHYSQIALLQFDKKTGSHTYQMPSTVLSDYSGKIFTKANDGQSVVMEQIADKYNNKIIPFYSLDENNYISIYQSFLDLDNIKFKGLFRGAVQYNHSVEYVAENLGYNSDDNKLYYVNQGADKLYLNIFDINYNSNNIENIALSKNGIPLDFLGVWNSKRWTKDMHYYHYFIKRGNKKYLIVITTLGRYAMTQTTSYGSEIIVIDVTNVDETANVVFYKVLPNYNYVFLRDKENKIIMGNQKQVDVYLINDNGEIEFVISNDFQEKGNIANIGYNMENNIILQTDNYFVYNLNFGVGTIIENKMEKEDYFYLGEDINTYIEFSTKDYLGNLTENFVDIQLIGDMVFFDSTKDKRVKTSRNGASQIPVIIKGSSELDCNIKFVEEEG